MKAPNIRFDNCEVLSDGQTLLSKVQLHLTERRIAIIGANGSGKTTFIKIINGLSPTTAGTISVNDIPLDKAHLADIRKQVGYIFQAAEHQLIMPVVEEDLAFGLKRFKLSQTEIESRIDAYLAHYNLLHLKKKSIYALSGGERQLIALLGVLITEPSWLLFDEPTTLLDFKQRKRFINQLEALEQHVILVTHDLDLIQTFDRVLVFNEGQIICDAAPDVAIPFYLNSMA